MKFLLDNWMLVAVAIVSGGGLLWPLVERRTAGGVFVDTLAATRLVNDRNAVLLDVRTSDEFARGHIVGSRNIPAQQLDARVAEVHKNKSIPVIVVSANGRDAGTVGARLRAAGYAEVVGLESGIAGWIASGLPLKK